MKTYKVTITETLKKTVEIQADSRLEAEQMAADAWHHAEYILDADSFADVTFEAKVNPRSKGLER